MVSLLRNIDTLERFCNLEKPTMAVLCVPRSAVESLSDRLYALESAVSGISATMTST